ncbi:MAG: 50S ribosomal protein L29 [bacterium]|nr:50S ribosomal protein L29 [bacterium]
MEKSKEQKGVIELKKDLEDLQKNLQIFKFDLSGGKLKNVRQIRKFRKDIALIKTIIKEKEK